MAPALHKARRVQCCSLSVRDSMTVPLLFVLRSGAAQVPLACCACAVRLRLTCLRSTLAPCGRALTYLRYI